MELLNKNGQPSARNPMTKVYEVVEGLKEYLNWKEQKDVLSKFI